jgi:hypothetical protein
VDQPPQPGSPRIPHPHPTLSLTLHLYPPAPPTTVRTSGCLGSASSLAVEQRLTSPRSRPAETGAGGAAGAAGGGAAPRREEEEGAGATSEGPQSVKERRERA